MAAPDDDTRIETLVRHFGDLTTAWQLHRDTVNRAINILSNEILQIRDWMTKDDRQRRERQEQLDAQIAQLQTNIARELAAIRHNQRLWLRFVAVVALLSAGLIIGWWLL